MFIWFHGKDAERAGPRRSMVSCGGVQGRGHVVPAIKAGLDHRVVSIIDLDSVFSFSCGEYRMGGRTSAVLPPKKIKIFLEGVL